VRAFLSTSTDPLYDRAMAAQDPRLPMLGTIAAVEGKMAVEEAHEIVAEVEARIPNIYYGPAALRLCGEPIWESGPAQAARSATYALAEGLAGFIALEIS
jgi:hypothetical protein